MFADKNHPLRCSQLASIPRCSGRIWLLDYLDCRDSEGGEAAQNGSLTHCGVAEFHKTEGRLDTRVKAAWDAIAANRAKFPLADTNEVKLFLTPYVADPRNIDAVFARMPDGKLAVEQQVDFSLAPHELDPTGLPIYIQGTFDQVRLTERGIPYVCDLKTGKISGLQMIHDYSVQLAAYTYGARQIWVNAIPGKIIRAHGYRVRDAVLPSPNGVFWTLPFDYSDIDILLENVRLHVALVRMGNVQFNPGPHCTYCEFGGLTGCLPRIKSIMYEGAKPDNPFIQLGVR